MYCRRYVCFIFYMNGDKNFYMKFNGSIVIGDPSFFIKNEDDWKACKYGECMNNIGFSDFMTIRFPDDPQVVIDKKDGSIIGGICQDSGYIVVVYLEELKKYNPDYEKALFTKENRTIIQDYDGEVSSERVEVIIDGYKDFDTVISGTGNICFQSCYEDDLPNILKNIR